MAKDINLNLDPRTFMEIIPTRQAAIEAAPASVPKIDYPANRLAQALHPDWQYVKVKEVIDHGGDAKSYVLVPDPQRGTKDLAYFSAGQYLCVYLEIGNSRILRPYSICSGPKDALSGSYTLTIKAVDDGFATDYIFENWQVGTAVTLTGPEGAFTYEPLRDAKHLIALAGGSGITPFYSLGCAIADGIEDCDLTILFGSRSVNDILMRKELDALAARSPRIKVVHVLSEEDNPAYEHGFITSDMVKKYAPDDDYSVFICGPQAMYQFADKELVKLSLRPGRIRKEAFGQIKDPASFPNYPGTEGQSFTLTVTVRDDHRQISCRSDETLLVAMERAGILAPSRCRSGGCGVCHAKLVKGEVFAPSHLDKRRLADVTHNYIHTCITYPLSDVELNVPGERFPIEA